MIELYATNLIKEQTLEDILYNVQQNINNVEVGGTYVGATMVGAFYKSAETGARVEILPDPYTGIICYASDNTQVFKTVVAGTDVGDVIMGNPSTYYAKWDQSDGKLKIVGPVVTSIQQGSEIAIQQWQSTLTFSATDYRVVDWTTGTITLMDGTAYSISSGNTGNMAALTYIYLDKAVSTTVLNVTTTATTAVGTGKILLAVAQNVSDITKYAKFQVFSGSGGIGGSWVAADNIIVTNLAAISANLGSITAGNITLDSSGYIKGGQTAYNTGTGFFLGYSTDAYKLSIGNSVDTSKLLLWDGTDLIVNDTKLFAQPIYGDGSDGNVTISSNTSLTADKFYNNLTLDSSFTLNPDGYRIFVKGTLTINGTIARNGNIGGNGGANDEYGTGGSALTTNTLGGSGVGGNGGTFGVGATVGGAANPSKGGNGGAGGNAAGDSGEGRAGGTATAPTQPINAIPFCIMLTDFPTTNKILGGGGGGGGGWHNVQHYGGAGGGSGGGVIFIAARKIVLNGSIEAKGGNGGNGYGGGGNYSGNGGGGGGGFVILIYNSKTGSGTIDVSGGSVGTGGSGGANGSSGNTIQLQF